MTLRRISLSIVAVIILAIIGTLVWLYTGSFTAAKMKIFSKVPLPAALVDNYPVSGKELMVRYAFAKGYLKNQQVNDSKLLNNIYQQYLDQKKLELVAKHAGVSVTNAELETQYQQILKDEAKGDEKALSETLQENYGISLADFKSKVLYIQQLQINLTTWYNKQADLNKEVYATAKDLMTQLQNGKSFSDVAKAYTQDQNGKAFDGDAGFITSKELLPEFQTTVEQAQLNKPVLAASRYGLHLINVSEKTGEGADTKYHVQQIFLKTTTFGAWMEQQVNHIKTTNLRSF